MEYNRSTHSQIDFQWFWSNSLEFHWNTLVLLTQVHHWNSKYFLYGAIIHHSPKNRFNSYPYVDQRIQVAGKRATPTYDWLLTGLSLQYCLQFTSSCYEKTSTEKKHNKMEKKNP